MLFTSGNLKRELHTWYVNRSDFLSGISGYTKDNAKINSLYANNNVLAFFCDNKSLYMNLSHFLDTRNEEAVQNT